MKFSAIIIAVLFPLTLLHAQAYDTIWVESIYARADTLLRAGNVPAYKTHFEAALKSAQNRYGPESMETACMLDYFGDVQKITGDYVGAEQSISTLLDIYKKHRIEKDERVAKAMGQLGFTRFRLGKYDTVEPLLTEARQMFNDLGMQQSYLQANVSTSLASFYQAQGFYLKAEQMHLEAIDIVKNQPVFEESVYSTLLNNLAVLYSNLQRSDDAIRCYDTALELKAKKHGKDHQFYLSILVNKGRLLTDAGLYGEAEAVLKEALRGARKIFAPDNVQLSSYLLGLALLYEKTGSYAEAIQLQEQSQILLKNRYGIEFPDYIAGLINLAVLHRHCNRPESADTLLRQALQILEQTNKTKTSMYPWALAQLGELYQQTKQYERARPILEKAARLSEQLTGKDHPAHYKVYGEALIRQDILENRPDTALNMLDQLATTVLNAYGDRHERYISLEAQYGTVWQLKGDVGKALKHFQLAFNALQQNLAENFRFLSVDEREKFARVFEAYRLAFLSFARTFPHEPAIQSFLYDLLLFQKELLASYDRQMLTNWQQNPDSTYQAYIELRRMIARQWTLPAKERVDLPELESQRVALEKTLASSATLPQTWRRVEWRQVQQVLQPGDAALEWLVVPPVKEGSQTPCYAALILRPGQSAPELALLPEVSRIDALFASKGTRGVQYATHTYAGDALYRMLWQALEPRLAGVERIFFAPAGRLHLVNFDAIQTSGGQLLGEKYQLVRVTNTARLLDAGFGEKLAKLNSALLAGGLDYESMTPAAADQVPQGLMANYLPWRGGSAVREWLPLPNTLPEVERLALLLNNKNIQTLVLSGSNGGETVVKSQCSGSPGILHFATHGFFFEKNTAASGSLGLVTAENPMFRSGLILSGANPAWRGEPIPNAADDGILTADEISILPLRNTALAVLSACETGLGDVHDDEGVYGLQRAFRLAGVQTILMSLWRVPDAQTRLFMEYFYTYLLEKGDARAAFHEARQAIRREFGNPYYWAGFILLE